MVRGEGEWGVPTFFTCVCVRACACQSLGPDGKKGSDVYYVGIMGLLTKYDARKKTEGFLKRLSFKRKKDLSAVNPEYYQRRFYDFVVKHVK